jgi:hypothetical protein
MKLVRGPSADVSVWDHLLVLGFTAPLTTVGRVTSSADLFVIKNVNTRLLITLIEDERMAFLAALLPIRTRLATAHYRAMQRDADGSEFVSRCAANNFLNEQRDRFIYRIAWRLKLCRASTRPFDDPTLITRNRTLRLRNLHVETTFEIICIYVAVRMHSLWARRDHSRAGELRSDSHSLGCCAQCFFVWRFGISRDGINPPKDAELLQALAMQVLVECLQSLGCNVWYEVVERQPTSSLPLLRMRGWTLTVTIMAVTNWCVVFTQMAPDALGRLAHSETNWVFLTQSVKSQINTTILCERFPDASFFAQYAGCPG